MSSERNNAILSDLIDISHGFAYKGKYFSDEPTKDILVTPGNFQIGGGFKKDKLKYYDGPIEEDYILKEGDLIVTMTDLSKKADTLGYSALVPLDENIYHHNQRIGLVLIKDSDTIDKHFLYFLLRSPNYRHHVVSQATGSTVKHTSPTKICSFEFELPPLDVQKNIASQLMNIEMKFNLNQQTNETLEAMAQAIFKSWFVDFDPVQAKIEARSAGRDTNRAAMAAIAGISLELDWDEIEAALQQKLDRMTEPQRTQLRQTAELFPDDLVESEIGVVPKGWGIDSIFNQAEYINGAAFKGRDFSKEKAGLPVIKIAELKSGISNQTKFTKKKVDDKYHIDSSDVLFSWSGNPDTSIDIFIWEGGEGLLNQHIFKIENESKTRKVFNYYFLKSMLPFFKRTAANKQTTGLGHVTQKDLKRKQVAIPSKELIKCFALTAEPIFDKVFSNLIETQHLSKLRDTLLPKLISGEIKLN